MRGVKGFAHSVAGPVRLCTEVRVVRVMLVELVQVLTGKEATYEYGVRRPNRGKREGRRNIPDGHHEMSCLEDHAEATKDAPVHPGVEASHETAAAVADDLADADSGVVDPGAAAAAAESQDNLVVGVVGVAAAAGEDEASRCLHFLHRRRAGSSAG
jgi:hypothetical protein